MDATATDLVKLPYGDLAEGFYVVGTGSTGIASRDGDRCIDSYPCVYEILNEIMIPSGLPGFRVK